MFVWNHVLCVHTPSATTPINCRTNMWEHIVQLPMRTLRKTAINCWKSQVIRYSCMHDGDHKLFRRIFRFHFNLFFVTFGLYILHTVAMCVVNKRRRRWRNHSRRHTSHTHACSRSSYDATFVSLSLRNSFNWDLNVCWMLSMEC